MGYRDYKKPIICNNERIREQEEVFSTQLVSPTRMKQLSVVTPLHLSVMAAQYSRQIHVAGTKCGKMHASKSIIGFGFTSDCIFCVKADMPRVAPDYLANHKV